ncbi:hypothetical protein X560_0889 [Listeria fleischmannii 1991]|uniref:Uncharacterized protein n=1 Tax=Listeria fleischmannii 1991 TaxID=1430899 RepID=A0A0J8GC82_9LIST|nr:hypothetical protein X560_0889 [Listeria fleischmannii 1991]
MDIDEMCNKLIDLQKNDDFLVRIIYGCVIASVVDKFK